MLVVWKQRSPAQRKAGLKAIAELNVEELHAALPAVLYEALNKRIRDQRARNHPKAKTFPVESRCGAVAVG